MKTNIYLDTTIISALFDKRTPERMSQTQQFWEHINEYIKSDIFPEKYLADALHVALASVNQIGILLSWNFTHLVKVRTRRIVAFINAIYNYNPVEIITPPEL